MSEQREQKAGDKKAVPRQPAPRLTTTRRRVQVATLLTDSTKNLKQRQVAQILGVSERQIKRDVAAIRDAVTDADKLMHQWNSRMNERLPMNSRVNLLGALCEQDEHLPTKLKALQYANSLQGIRVPEPLPQGYNGSGSPAFIFPAGAYVSVAVPAVQQIVDIEKSEDRSDNE